MLTVQLSLALSSPSHLLTGSVCLCVSADPAIPVLRELISCDYEAARTRIIISGASSSCSQKIHNLQRGILEASQDSKYVLCLDDDVQLHPGFLEMAVGHMEADSAAFMLTGQSPSAPAVPPPSPTLFCTPCTRPVCISPSCASMFLLQQATCCIQNQSTLMSSVAISMTVVISMSSTQCE